MKRSGIPFLQLCAAAALLSLLTGCSTHRREVERARAAEKQTLQEQYAEVHKAAEKIQQADLATAQTGPEQKPLEPCATKPAGELAVDLSLPLAPGKNVPPFVLTDMRGEPLDLEKTLCKSKLSLLLFADHICPFSDEAYDMVNQLAAKYPRDQLGITAVHVGEMSQDARDYYKGMDLKYAVAVDADFSVARRYGLKSVPTVFLVKPDTQIHYTELYNPRIDENIAAYFEDGGDVKPAPHKPAGGVFG